MTAGPHAGVARADPGDPDAVVFRVGEQDYRWRDVFAHARRRGTWATLDRQVREALACQRMLVEEALTPSVGEERSVARQFRVARRLYAAEDVEAWLDEGGLRVAHWRDYVRGVVLRRRHEADLAAIVSRYPPSDEDVEGVRKAWGVCSGAFSAWAEDLAAAAAAAAAVHDGDPSGDAPPGPQRLDRVDELHRRFVAAVATPERIDTMVARHHLEWLRLDLEEVVFRTEGAAREALLCVRDDGWTLAEAARTAGADHRVRSLLLGDADERLRPHLLQADEGGLVGPLQCPTGWAVLLVRDRTTPSRALDDVRARAVAEVTRRAEAREVDDRVRWLRRP